MKATFTATWIVDVKDKKTREELKETIAQKDWNGDLVNAVFELDWVAPETWTLELKED